MLDKGIKDTLIGEWIDLLLSTPEEQHTYGELEDGSGRYCALGLLKECASYERVRAAYIGEHKLVDGEHKLVDQYVIGDKVFGGTVAGNITCFNDNMIDDDDEDTPSPTFRDVAEWFKDGGSGYDWIS